MRWRLFRLEIDEGFFLGDWDGVKEGLKWRFVEAVSALVGRSSLYSTI
jgi:hypothetical protein